MQLPKLEEILNKHCKNGIGIWIGITKQGALQAMKEFAGIYHRSKLRDELIDFAIWYDGDTLPKESTIDKYLKYK